MKEIHLETTLHCPNNCIHCSGLSKDKIPHKDLISIQKVIRAISRYKSQISEVAITGGEPLSRQDLSHIIRDLGHIPCITVFTSGVNKDNAIAQSRWEGLKESGLNRVVFSVHSTNSEVNDYIFNKHVLNLTLQSIKWAQEAGLEVQINSVLMKANFDCIQNSVDELIHQYKVDLVRILRFVAQGRGESVEQSMAVDDEKQQELIIGLRKKFGNKVHFEGYPRYFDCRSNPEVGGGCQHGRGFLHIDINGDIYPCPAVKQCSKTKLGSVFNQSELDSTFKQPTNVSNGSDDYFGCASQATWKL